MQVYAGTGRKSHRGGETLSHLKKKKKKKKPHPRGKRAEIPRSGFDSSLRWKCRYRARRGRDKASGRRRQGKGAGAARQKARPRLPRSRRSPLGEAASNELTTTRAQRTPTLDVTLRVPRGRRARPPRAASRLPPASGRGAAPNRGASPAPQPLTNRRQGSPLPPEQTPSLGRPHALASSPLPLPGGWGLECVSLTPQLPEPRQPFQGAPGKPRHKTAAALQP